MSEVDAVMACAVRIQRLAEEHQRAAQSALAEHGINESGTGLLWILGSSGPAPMRSLAHELACDPSNVTILAAHLDSLGLTERVRDPADGRRRLLRLTAQGQACYAAMIEAVRTTSPLTALSERDIESLLALLTATTSSQSAPSEPA